MTRNLGPAERIVRVILGLAILGAALLMVAWAGWVRGLVGLAGVALLATAAGGY